MSHDSGLVLDPAAQALLGRYYAGACTPEEELQAERLIEAYPTELDVIHELRARPAEASLSTAECNAAFGVVMAKVAAEEHVATKATVAAASAAPRRRPFAQEMLRPGRMAAIVASVVASVVIMAISIRASVSGPSSPTHTYATTIGQQATLTLEDGSRVTLAPQSRLTVPTEFGRSIRTVDLSGESYFDVRTAAGTPFVVRTGTIIIRVLGTTFDVRRYLTDRVTLVAVTAGKVVVGGSHAQRAVAARTIAIASDSNVVSHAIEDPDQYVGWTHGRLVFDDVPVVTALATLGRWYGYHFRLADSVMARKRLTGEFRADAFEETLVGLKKVLNVSMTFNGTTITLAPLRAGTSMPGRRDSHDALVPSTEIGR